MELRVVGLGAWCDLVIVDEYHGRSAGAARQSGGAAQSLEMFRQALHFRVEEFATLSDGRRLTLTDDLGWSSKMSGGRVDDDPWAHLTIETVMAAVRNVVLPDDAEETGESYSWARLAERLETLGVEATIEDLKGLPYDVTLSRRLHARLSQPDR